MKIERAWLRIIVSVIVGGFASAALYSGGSLFFRGRWLGLFFIFTGFLAAPIVATVLAHVLTPREKKDGHTRCGKCGERI